MAVYTHRARQMPPFNPTELARETLKQLASRQLLPTPQNFERVYLEIAGNTPPPPPPQLAERLGSAFAKLAPQSPGYRLGLAKLQQLLSDENWEQVPPQLIELVIQHQREKQQGNSWGNLILSLLKLWDLRLPDLSQNYKQAALERLIINFGNQPELLHEKLTRLLQDWGRGLVSEAATADGNRAEAPAPAAGHAHWCTLLSLVLQRGLEPRLQRHPTLLTRYQELLQRLSSLASDAAAVDEFTMALRHFLTDLELQQQQDERLVSGLSNLLQLLLRNIAELNRSDSYLLGQIDSLQAMLASPELTMQQIYQLEVSLKEVIEKQGQLKSSLDEAASSLRELLGTFLDQLVQMSGDTEKFQHKVAAYHQRLQTPTEAADLRGIVDSLLQDTDSMQQILQHSQQGLQSAQDKVEAAQGRITELEHALEAASYKVKEDQLTGAYNRRGLEEHFSRELHRAERTGSPLSVALIDVDNFKQLNDRYGHLTGDHALRFIADAIRHNLRPSDICARFGGEEFVVLLPDTPITEATQAIERLQRELTRTFFLTNNQRLVITFSAGVALWHKGEKESDVIDRADRAMYQAKLAGKNQTLSAEDSPYNLDLPA